MTRCYCRSCRARDDRRFHRIIDANYSHAAQTIILARETAATVGATMVDRIGRYGLPPVPTWEGEPRELYAGEGDGA